MATIRKHQHADHHLFTLFTHHARQAWLLAQEEAERLQQDRVAPEHLLLGIVKIGDSAAAHVLRALHIELRPVRLLLEKSITLPEQRVYRDENNISLRPARSHRPVLWLTPTCRNTLAFAGEEAKQMGHSAVNTAHLLVGIMREQSLAAEVLSDLGTSLELIRAQTVQELSRGEEPIATAYPPSMGKESGRTMVECWLDEQTLELLDMLIASGFGPTRSAVATGLIGKGLSAERHLTERLRAIADEIQRLREAGYLQDETPG